VAMEKRRNGGHELEVRRNSNISAADCLGVKVQKARYTFSRLPNIMGPRSTSLDITGNPEMENSPFHRSCHFSAPRVNVTISAARPMFLRPASLMGQLTASCYISGKWKIVISRWKIL